MNKTYNLILTNWDCYILQRALWFYVHRHYHTDVDIYFHNNYGHEKHLYKAFQDIKALKQHVNWSTTTRKTFLNDVTQLSSYNKIHDIGLDASYNPHDYRACLNKLKMSINKEEV